MQQLFGDSWEDDDATVLVWDGKGSMDIVANAAHVHDVKGNCVKRRYARRCGNHLGVEGIDNIMVDTTTTSTPIIYNAVCMQFGGGPKTLQENVEVKFYREIAEKSNHSTNQYVDRYKNQPQPPDLGKRLWDGTTGPNPRAWPID